MMRKVVAEWPEGDSFISDLLRQSLGLEKEREWRRKDGYDEEGGG